MTAFWHERDRLAALDSYGILDTPPEAAFDDLVVLLVSLLDVPIAAVNLIAAGRQWFKSEIGLGLREMPIDNSICAHAILQPGGMIIPDATLDPRFDCNPLVTGEPGIRFYAGELLETPAGLPLGTLCVLDTKPRPGGLTAQHRAILKTFARQLMDQIELRRALAERDAAMAAQRRAAALNQQIIDSAKDYAIIATGHEGRVTRWTKGAKLMFGWDADEMLGQTAERIFILEDRSAERMASEFAMAQREGQAADNRWHVRKDGTHFWATGAVMPLRDDQDRLNGFIRILQDRTEAQSVAAKLAVSEERYRSLFNNIEAGLCTIEVAFDDDGRATDYRFLEVNPAFARHTGLNGAAGRWVRELAPGNEQHWYEIYGRVALTGESVSFELPADALDGRWFSVLAFRIGQPEARQVAVLFNDVSARRRAELALDQLNKNLEQQVTERTRERDRIWQVSHDMLGVADTAGVWRSVNPAWSRILGWPAEDFIGKTTEWLEHPHDQADTRAEIARLASGLPTINFENRFLAQDGSYRLLSWTATPVDDALYCVARDITQDREREIALRDSQDFTRLALSAVGGVGVWTYDVASDRFTCDASVAELYGIDPVQAAVGIRRKDFLANVHPDDVPKLKATMSGGLVNSGDLELEYRLRKPDGTARWVLSRGHTYFDANGNPIRRTGVGVETTVQRNLEEQLRQSQKMEAVGQLTGGLAHDFNNLLTGITGGLELLQMRIAQGRTQDAERYINASIGAARRAATLTHRLLAFSRQQTLQPKPTDINLIVASMMEMVQRTVGPEIAVEPVASADLWTSLVDPGQLENALLNLCINARDAMPDGGKLTIETANLRLDERGGRERGLPSGQYVTLAVRDTGTGMTPDVIARAFDPFFTTKPIGQGTGLGLSMIYGFARQSGGQVRIHSQPGSGTTVSIHLPRHLGQAEIAEALPALNPSLRASRNQTVLVVDDEPTVRMLVTDVLEELGYGSLEAADGIGALQILRSDARIDLLITDVGLPGGMNGRQVAEVAREMRPDLKVLFITGYAENAMLSHGHLAEGMQILTKPFAMEGLGQRISDMIAE